MFFFKHKQKKKETVPIPTSDDRTFFVTEGESDEKTEFLGVGAKTDFDQIPKFTIKLTDLKNQGRTWTLPVVSELVVGRAEHCIVQFYDQSVSREQFKIVVQGEELCLVQTGSTNLTKRNEVPIEKTAPLRSGDILKFGRESLRVDYIETRQLVPDLSSDWDDVPYVPDQDNEDNTMSFF